MSVANDGLNPSILLLLDPRPLRGGGSGGGLIRPGLGRLIDSEEFLESGTGLSIEDRRLPCVGAVSVSGSSKVGAKSCEGLLDVDVCLRIGGGGGLAAGRAGSAGEVAGERVLALSSLLYDGNR